MRLDVRNPKHEYKHLTIVTKKLSKFNSHDTLSVTAWESSAVSAYDACKLHILQHLSTRKLEQAFGVLAALNGVLAAKIQEVRQRAMIL